jgi:hypothetical protein
MKQQMKKQTMKAEQNKQIVVKHKSVKLKAAELKKLKSEVNEFPSQEVAASEIGINHRNTLANIMAKGSGSSDNIEIIKNYLKRIAA